MNPSTRTISATTLARVAAMSQDPASTPALRAFHAASLADLRQRAARQAEPVRGNPFDRFIQKLETVEIEPL